MMFCESAVGEAPYLSVKLELALVLMVICTCDFDRESIVIAEKNKVLTVGAGDGAASALFTVNPNSATNKKAKRSLFNNLILITIFIIYCLWDFFNFLSRGRQQQAWLKEALHRK